MGLYWFSKWIKVYVLTEYQYSNKYYQGSTQKPTPVYTTNIFGNISDKISAEYTMLHIHGHLPLLHP